MKKFLVFCLICIVTVSLGLMTYRFLTLEENVVVNQTVFEVNVNEEIPLEVTVLNSKGSVPKVISSDTSLMYYDESLGKYMAKDKGGKATFTVEPLKSTSAPIIVTVTIGDGSEQSPYFIKSAEDLALIGKATNIGGDLYYTRPLDAYYKLIADIDLSTYNNGIWTPIGSKDNPFVGVINCNNHVIAGLNISQETTNAGLFASIGANDKGIANITGGLVIDQANLNGAFDNAGALAGINSGLVEKVIVSSSSIISTKTNANVGGLVGTQYGDVEKIAIFKTGVKASGTNSNAGGITGLICSNSTRSILNRSYCEGVDVNASLNAGGLVGLSKGGIIVNSYAKKVTQDTNILGKISTATTTNIASLGGIVGRAEIYNQKKTTIVDCYAVVKVEGETNQKRGQLVGYVVDAKNGDVITKNDIYGLYYEADNSNLLGLGYIQNVGFTTRETEQNNYLYVYNDLEKSKTQTTLFSHYDESSKEYNWASAVWTFSTTDYPVLDLDGPYFDISTLISSIYDASIIDSAEKLSALRNRVNNGTETEIKIYTLGADIDLTGVDWEGIGTETNPFKSILTCPTDANGMPIYKITGLTISAGTTNNDSYASTYNRYRGLFGVIAGQGKVSNIYVESPQVKKGQYVGGIAGINYGSINNCYVVSTTESATIETNNIGYKNSSVVENTLYIGGIAGFNNGTIANCQVQGVLIQQFNALASQTTLYMGGITGSNAQTIENSAVKGVAMGEGKNLIYTNKAGTQYIGGIAGVNSYLIRSSFVSKGDNTLTIKASTGNDNSYIGGIAGLNEDSATIELSFANVNVEGTYVGGIASRTYGSIDQCYSIGDLTGLHVGGVAYKVENGKVSNCYVAGTIYGSSKDSEKAGLAIDITLVNEDERNASIVNCFSQVYFDNTGSNYYDTKCLARRDEFWAWFYNYKRVSGFVVNCIYDRSTDNATRSNDKSAEWDKFPWDDTETIINNYNSDKSYYSYRYDCGMTTDQITSVDGASVFRTYGFDENIWQLGGGNVPTLKRVVKYR